jgi:hypothetical protein
MTTKNANLNTVGLYLRMAATNPTWARDFAWLCLPLPVRR